MPIAMRSVPHTLSSEAQSWRLSIHKNCGRAKSWIPLLYDSLHQLLALPERTMVLPAHFSHMHEADERGCYAATLGALRGRNEGLHMSGQELPAFSAYIEASLPEHPQSYDDIRRVNTGLLQVDEAKASEMELGRNRCALSQREAPTGK